jgi:predicted secreted protein
MAALAGKGGSIKLGTNAVAEMGEWSLDLELDTQEDTAFGDDWKSYLAGLKGWSGSGSGRWDMTDTNGQKAIQDALLNGTALTLKLYVDATHNYSGSAFVTGLSPSATVDGMVEISFDFQGSGSLTYA